MHARIYLQLTIAPLALALSHFQGSSLSSSGCVSMTWTMLDPTFSAKQHVLRIRQTAIAASIRKLAGRTVVSSTVAIKRRSRAACSSSEIGGDDAGGGGGGDEAGGGEGGSGGVGGEGGGDAPVLQRASTFSVLSFWPA